MGNDEANRVLLARAGPLLAAIEAVRTAAMQLSDRDLLNLQDALERGDLHMAIDKGDDDLLEQLFQFIGDEVGARGLGPPPISFSFEKGQEGH